MKVDGHTYQVRDHPVEGEPAGECEGEEGQHQRHHPQHHVVGRLLSGICGGDDGHLLLGPCGDSYHHGQQRGWVRIGQVEPQEIAAQRHRRVGHGVPGVEPLGEPHQVVRRGAEAFQQRPVQGEPYGYLDNQRAQAAQRVHSRLAVEAHHLLGPSLRLLGEALLDLLHSRLKRRHGLHRLRLLDHQWQRGEPNEDSKGNDGQPEVAEQDAVKHHQDVQHRVD